MTAIHAFFAFLYGLEHYPNTCTAHVLVGGTLQAPQYAANYMGNCAQAFLLVLQHFSTYFNFNG